MNERARTLLATASAALFFLQALRVAFSTLFGVIYDQIFEGPLTAWLLISNLLLIAALLAPTLLTRRSSHRYAAGLVIASGLARLSLSIDDALIRFWGSLLVLALAGNFLALQLRRERSVFASALAWGVLSEFLLRALGDSFDISLQDGSLPYVAVGVSLLIALVFRQAREGGGSGAQGEAISLPLALGLGSFIFMETSLFAMPGAVARYSRIAYPPVAVLLFVSTALILLPRARAAVASRYARRGLRSAISLLGLAGFLMGYFFEGWLAAGGLLFAQFALMAGVAFAVEASAGRPRQRAARFSLGLLWMLVLNFLNAFAFTYPYTLPVMRGKGWLVYLAAGVVFAWSVIRPQGRMAGGKADRPSLVHAFLAASAALVLIAAWPRAAQPLPADGRLRLATWNIHYGYDDEWHTNLQQMARAIEAEGVDVIAMQEVDTGRMTSYSVDDAYFLARRLGMNAAYLPAVEHLTGIALLYKGPPAEVDERLLTSLQEQTGIVRVTLRQGTARLYAHGVWMGLSDEDTQRQIEEALAFIGDRAPASFGGDFNASDGEPVPAAVRAAGFLDPFERLGQFPAPPTSPAIDPQSRIDYVWLRGVDPLRAWAADSLASDHRMVVAEVDWP